MSARSNSEASSNASSPPSSIHMPGNNQVINNNNNAPKYGTLVPNRVFVGGIPSNTTEPELCQLFSKYGNVKATKIIADRAGVSKGYGFVTFETEEEAKRLQSDADNIVLRERRLNIAPAVKKQPFSRVFESATSPPPATPSLYYHNGMPYTFHNGMAYFPQTPNQGAAAMPTPDLPAVFQGGGFGPQSNTQSYGPAMMYPCGANPAATMFISPQPYNPYPHMPVPTQGPPPLMYTGGPTPSTNQANNNTSENTQSVQMATGPPAPYYLPPAMTQAPEMYYNIQPTPSQSCYAPVVALASHDGVMHYCDVPVEQGSNSITTEENYSSPTQERPASNVSQLTTNDGDNNCTQQQCKNEETPVVSLLSLQDDETLNRNKPPKFSNAGKPDKFVGLCANREPLVGYASNGVSYQVSKNRGSLEVDRLDKEYSNIGRGGRGRGTLRGRGARNINSNPRAPHDNNNNHHHHHNYTEKQENGEYRADIANRGMKGLIRGGRSRGVIYNRGGRRGSAPSNFPSPSLSPSLPTHPMNMHHPRHPRPSHINPYNPNFKTPPPLQMQQQVFHQRGFPNPFYPHYTPMHQQAPPPPPPPQPTVPPPQQSRRYGNGSKKPTNGATNSHMTGNRKLKTVEGMDSGAAGDGPVPNMVSLTPPSSPGTSTKTSATGTNELCTHIQALAL